MCILARQLNHIFFLFTFNCVKYFIALVRKLFLIGTFHIRMKIYNFIFSDGNIFVQFVCLASVSHRSRCAAFEANAPTAN